MKYLVSVPSGLLLLPHQELTDSHPRYLPDPVNVSDYKQQSEQKLDKEKLYTELLQP